jgi:GT2 family glycosyltransferase
LGGRQAIVIHSRVTAIVINWNLKEQTLRCLRSLAQLDVHCSTIVVDNGSSDGSAECFLRHFPGTKLIPLTSNIGFGSACNRAITRVLEDDRCDYILLLNNDAVVHPHALSELLKAARLCPEAGILGPKIYNNDDSSTIWYAGARRRWGVFAVTDTGRGQVDRGQFNRLREVDYVFGAAMLIRRGVFERIGLFDERFFLYLEDLDFCLRAQSAGFSLLFVPDAHVWHSGSASTAHNPAVRNYHLVKSTVGFLRKHTPSILIVPVLSFWILVYLRAILSDLARGDLEAIRAYWSGLKKGLAELRIA